MSDSAVLVVGPAPDAPQPGPTLTGAPGGRAPTLTGPAGDRTPTGVPLLAGLSAGLRRLLGRHSSGSGLTSEDRRVLAILGVAVVVALGGQAEPVAPSAPVELPAAAASATAAQVVELAQSHVGTVEARGGGTPYHRDYGIAADQPWCAVFVEVVFEKAGAGDLIHPKTAYTPTLAGWFQERGQWSSTPTVGALVFYDWPGDSKKRIQHVGLVVSFDADSITTIEANTSNSDQGSQDDGDGVWLRKRPRNDSIVGYGHPSYGLAA